MLVDAVACGMDLSSMLPVRAGVEVDASSRPAFRVIPRPWGSQLR